MDDGVKDWSFGNRKGEDAQEGEVKSKSPTLEAVGGNVQKYQLGSIKDADMFKYSLVKDMGKGWIVKDDSFEHFIIKKSGIIDVTYVILDPIKNTTLVTCYKKPGEGFFFVLHYKGDSEIRTSTNANLWKSVLTFGLNTKTLTVESEPPIIFEGRSAISFAGYRDKKVICKVSRKIFPAGYRVEVQKDDDPVLLISLAFAALMAFAGVTLLDNIVDGK
mmetsp:Transcript_41968/g.68075  ORF Transcript_41968/g.68075 Transcript_41968/m.68075 type:complete len:218 (+) Transcript_41968:45-698(+)|eukprot:CAMPEP_0184338090 /NCGR_PEP_ID=MMETSP1089-20130417/6610_1 /TAXON_ID=38269 ORGANISM="Gloeochaete wittrockiana, Strain SAG46.84" /NCGR_SAMPLE_ID=MMETSP1089 /ASSEMBLY_ACC=CAM_ASM_000445 /LENGTH=217 /DNA_ID=CAMNT_0026664363 /DNA_START=49 /DNA_END=702 /DNA_ORIENTATION=-